MRALRKGQAAIFNLTQDIRGEARIVERASASVSVRSRKLSRSLVKSLTFSLLDVCGRATTRTSLPGPDCCNRAVARSLEGRMQADLSGDDGRRQDGPTRAGEVPEGGFRTEAVEPESLGVFPPHLGIEVVTAITTQDLTRSRGSQPGTLIPFQHEQHTYHRRSLKDYCSTHHH